MQPGRGEKEGSSTVLLPRYSRSAGEEVAGGVGEVGGVGGVWSKIFFVSFWRN